MSKTFTDNEKLKIDLPKYTGKPGFLLNRHVMFGLLSFFMLAILFGSLIYQRHLIIMQEQKKEALHVANNAKDRLQESLAYSLSATKILAFFIDNNGTVKNFDSVAAEIFNTNGYIDVLHLAPVGVVQYVYPLKGNESLIGYNILKDPAKNKEAFKAIQKNELFFSAPFKFIQGGLGIAGRLPVFKNEKFWGFSVVVIKVSTLLKAAGIDRAGKDGYYYQLSKINPDTKKTEFFITDVKQPLKDYLISVDIPDGNWKLSVEPVDNNKGRAEIFIFSLLSFLVSVLGAIFVFIIVKRPEKLYRLVGKRTKELKSSENKYQSLIERVSDAFVSLDNNWNYVYVNKKAGEIFGRKPESLVGKNIWAEFPEGVDMPFYHAYYRAKETQQYQYLEDYFPMHEKWFENHIYPSKDGLTSFFKDITEFKKASEALKENEEKYRSLIEQASDGIMLYSFNGSIHSFNKVVYTQTGYTKEEFENLNLKDLFFEDGFTEKRPKDKKLQTDKATILYRKLKRKDGSVFVVEMNARLLPDGKILAIVRDITEREKSETALKKSEEKFSKIFNSNLLGFVLYDDDFRIVNVNAPYAAFIESARDKLLGKTSDEAGLISKINPEKRIAISQKIEDILNTEGRLSNFEIEVETKNGALVTILLSIERLELNNKTHWLASAIDITLMKKAEQARVYEEQSRQLIMNSALDAIITINAEGAITLWNPQATKIFGWSEEEIKGKLLSATIIPQQYRDRHEKGMKHYLQTGEGPILNKMFQMSALDRQGREFPIELSIIPLEQNGQQSFCAFIRDITVRKNAEEELLQSEQKYKLLFYNNPLPMWMATIPNLDIIDVNEAAIKQYGYTRTEFLKLNERDMRPAEDVADFDNYVKKMKPGISTRRVWRHKKKDETIIHVDVYGHEIFYEGQQAWLALLQDITEKYLAEELLQKSYKDIRQLASSLQSIREDERTNIAREIHDELGQQLTGLKMDIHWLARKINGTDKEINDKMKESIELINRTIVSVRKISTNLRPSILDDLGLLAALEWQGEEFQKRSGTKVEFINNAGELTVQPEATTGIFRIYQELLTNIARHANASLVTAVFYKDDNRLYFSITDNGVGFNLETINNKKTLGLLGIKERTLLLGGTYEIKSKPGEGSETTISVPLNLVESTI